MTTYPEFIPLESPIAAPSEVDDQFKQAARQFLDRIANEATVSVGASAPPLVFDDDDDEDDVEQPAIVTTTDKQVVDDRKAAPPLCLDDAPATDGAVLGDASDMPAEKVGLLAIIDKQIAELERTRAALLHCDYASVDSPPSAGAPVNMVTTPRKRAFDRYLADHTFADDDVFVRRSRPLIRPPTPPVPLSADVDRTFDGRAAKRSRHESNDRDRRPLAADTTLVKRFDNLWRHWRLTSSEPIVKNKLLDAYCMLRANDGCLVLHPRGLQADLLLRGSPRLFLAFDDNPEQFGRVREQGGRHVWSSNRLRVLTSFEDAMLDASTELRDYAAERGFRCDSKQSLYHAAAHAKNRGYHKVAAGLALSWYADTESSGSENARLPLVRLCVQPVPAYNHAMLCAAQSGRRARARLCRPQHAVRDKNEQMTLYVTRIVVDLRRILLSSSDNSHLLSYTK